MVEQCVRPADGRRRVYLDPDRAAEFGDANGRLVSARGPLHRIGKLLAEYGYGLEDLLPE